MTSQLHAAVAALIATARAAHPGCPDWQLTMNPETYLLFTAEGVVTGFVRGTVVSFFDGCRVWPEPTCVDAVVCSPLVDPGIWDLPPEYYLDLRDNTISTNPPMQVLTINAGSGLSG